MKSKYRKSKNNRTRKLKKGGAYMCEEELGRCEKKIQELNIEINRLKDELNDIRNLKDTLATEIQGYRLKEQPHYKPEDILRFRREDREKFGY